MTNSRVFVDEAASCMPNPRFSAWGFWAFRPHRHFGSSRWLKAKHVIDAVVYHVFRTFLFTCLGDGPLPVRSDTIHFSVGARPSGRHRLSLPIEKCAHLPRTSEAVGVDLYSGHLHSIVAMIPEEGNATTPKRKIQRPKGLEAPTTTLMYVCMDGKDKRKLTRMGFEPTLFRTSDFSKSLKLAP